MSITAYAATHNAKRQAATKWAAKGALVMSGGQVDVEASDARMQAMDLGRFRVRIHGGRRAAGVHGKVDRPATALKQATDEFAFAEEYPHLLRSRSTSPVGCAAEIERIVFAKPIDRAALFEELDALALDDFEQERQAAEWHRWPSRVAPALAAELGIPKKAPALEAALRRLIVERLERDLMIDAEVYLAPCAGALAGNEERGDV